MNAPGLCGGATGKFGVELRPKLPQFRLRFADMAILAISIVCSACLLGLATGLRNHGWVAWVGLVPLFLAIRSLSPLRALVCGVLWGFCLNGVLISGNGLIAAPFSESAALLVLVPAVYAFVGAYFTRRIGFSPLFLALGWEVVELTLRLLGLSTGLLASSQGNTAIIQQVGMPLGYLFVAFVIAFVNAQVISVVHDARFHFSRSTLRSCSGEHRARIVSQSFPCFPIITRALCRPRGPPVYATLSSECRVSYPLCRVELESAVSALYWTGNRGAGVNK